MIADHRIWFGPDGNGAPRLKKFLTEVTQGLVPKTLWLADEVGTTGTAKAELLALFAEVAPFATPKPEALLQRVVQIGSNPGEIVLDCFLGSGTSAAVAHKLGRRWVGVERSKEAIDGYATPRLTKVVEGRDPGGVAALADWHGGGGFRILDVAPSMFTAEGGLVFLSEWATYGKLAEATAAQLHYAYAYDPPFCGRRGRSRLAVIDGLVNEAVVRLLVDVLPADEGLVVCGTAIDPAARDVLRALRRGSTVRKIPQSILQDYRQATRWTQPSLLDANPNGATAPLTVTADG